MRRAYRALRHRLLGVAADARRRAFRHGMDALTRGLAAGGRLLPDQQPGRHGIKVLADVPYLQGTGPDNTLDIFRPASAPPWPVVLYVHGGGFHIGSKETHRAIALRYARQGYLTFNLNYRQGREHPFPAPLVDVGCALLWLREHAAGYGGDLERLVLAGESAGGNLVTALTVACCVEREEPWATPIWELGLVPRAVVAGCGLLQVSQLDRLVGGEGSELSIFVRDRMWSAAAAYLGDCVLPEGRRALADPVVVLERLTGVDRPLPPFFAPVGTADPLLDDTRRLAVAVERLGGRCDARYYAGEHHAFFALPWREAARRCWHDTFAFLAEQLGPVVAS